MYQLIYIFLNAKQFDLHIANQIACSIIPIKLH